MKFCRLEDDPGGVSCSGYYLFWVIFFGNPFQYSQEHVMAVIFGSNCKGLRGIVTAGTGMFLRSKMLS